MNFKNYLQNEPDLIIIEVDGRILTKLKLGLVSEGVWKDSNISDWIYRVDPPNPQMKIKRHIHIAKSKNTNKQVSWNDDHTRHDKHSFSDNIKGLEIAKQIARNILGLDPNVKLESLNKSQQLLLLLEHSCPSKTIYLTVNS